jgi:hypothetical protein
VSVSDSVDLTFTVAAAQPDAPSTTACTLSPEQCANIANGCPDGQRMIFAGKVATGDCEPIPSVGQGISGSCVPDQPPKGRAFPSGATFSAYHCGTGKPGEPPNVICERLGPRSSNLKRCGPNQLPYLKLVNHDTGGREVEMGCMDRDTCVHEWYQGTSDNDRCTTFDTKFVQTLDFECTFCCVGDACNGNPRASCLVQPGTLWTNN